MTDNQKRELRTSFLKMIAFCTMIYGALTGLILLENSPDEIVFIWLVVVGYVVSLIMLLYQIYKTYKK